MRSLEGGTTTVNHPVVGELHLHRGKLPAEDLLLVLYYGDQGSTHHDAPRVTNDRNGPPSNPTVTLISRFPVT